MFGIGGSEILVILVIALLFLGPDKLPDAAKQISKGIRDLKKQGRILTQTIENDETIGGALRDIKSALSGDEIAPRPKKPVVNKIEGNKPAELAEAKPDAADAAKTGDVAANIINQAAAAKRPAEAELTELIAARDKALHEADVAQRLVEAAQAQKSVTLPPTAGEPNAEDSDLKGTHDASALAALIKPPPGEPIQREAPAADDEPKLKHG
ncbi:MAG: twin-arginine translocase TatA/TatE family subunit [Kofleriaceae bacterium]